MSMYFDIPLFELPSLAGRFSNIFDFWVLNMFVQEVSEKNYSYFTLGKKLYISVWLTV